MDSAKEKDSEKKAGGRRMKTLARKRARETQSEESTKKQKQEDDVEEEELRLCMKIVSNEDIDVDYEVLDRKYPIILVDSKEDDDIWKNQHEWKMISWKLYKTCGVHTLMVDGTIMTIHMFVEKRYPLTKETLEKMLNWRLETDAESSMAYELIRNDQGLGSTALRNFDLEVMEFESAQSNTTAKLPILKLGDYEMWVMRIKQYFQVQVYALWEVIENGNEATKKTQKTLLKQQYENFNASSTESLDSIFNRLQKLVSRLEILGVVITQEDLNSKFLRSLPPKWNTHVVVWMNKADIETMSIDDFNTNDEVSTASTHVNTASTNVNTASTQDGTVNLRYDKSKVECFNCHKMGYFARESRNPRSQESRPRNYDHGSRNQESSKRTVNLEETSSKAMLAIDGVGFDWSDMAEEQIQTNMALMAFSDSG
ncbi:hypothetical protein Tco_1267050, partial [Tanacetum coccineum]